MRWPTSSARGEVRDEVLSRHSLTVPEVRMTPDLKLATVFVIAARRRRRRGRRRSSIWNKHKRYLRGELAQRVSLKFMPELQLQGRHLVRKRRAGSTSCSPRRKSPATSTTKQMASEADNGAAAQGPARQWLADPRQAARHDLDQAVDQGASGSIRPPRPGHAGTLDPLATGVLPIALGEATKTVPVRGRRREDLPLHRALRRRDRHRRRGGRGRRDERDAASTRRRSRPMLPSFTGEISRCRRASRRIKIDGERAYDLARDGEDFELAAAHRSRSTALASSTCPDADHCRVRSRMRQGHLCSRARPRSRPRARRARPRGSAAAHPGRARSARTRRDHALPRSRRWLKAVRARF